MSIFLPHRAPWNVSANGNVWRAGPVIVQSNVRRVIGPNGKEIWITARGYHRGIDRAVAKKAAYSAERKRRGRWAN